MKALFLAICLCIIPSIAQADQTTIKPFFWKSERMVYSGTVKVRSSQVVIDNTKLEKIKEEYLNIKRSFFTFERLGKCDLGLLDIRILTSKEMNDFTYFKKVADDYKIGSNGYEYYGRYFRGTGILYITYDGVFYNPKKLAHEMAHYFYDKCDRIFANEDMEHRKIDIFLRKIK